MAVYYEGGRVSWIIPGMKPGEDINLDPKSFSPKMLPRRRIEMDRDHTLVAIPDIPGRISTRKDGYIELILERHYDKEARQTRNRKVIIGSDASGFLPGMMSANDNYYDLFDARGKLFHDPMKEEEQTAQKQQPSPPAPNGHAATRTNNRPDNKPEQTQTDHPFKQSPTKSQKDQPVKTEENKTDSSREDALYEREVAVIRREAELKKKELELQAWEEELEKQQDEILLQASEADSNHIRILSYMLDSYIDTVAQQAKRKPDAPMTKKQIQTINELLKELRDFFTNTETEPYLHLAEEPDEETSNPGTTNGEMALLLTAYKHTTSAYFYKGLRKKQKP